MLLSFKNEDFLRVFKNFISLVVLNIVNYVFPIIIIPILIKRLGVDVYGKYIFCFTILSYLNLLVQYGFNISATNKIAKNPENEMLISETYSAVTIIRLIISLIITFFMIMSILLSNVNIALYLSGIGIFIGQGLIPVWLFQGIEKMKFLTIVNVVVRIIAFLLILILVHSAGDVELLMSIQSISFFVGAFVSMVIVRYRLRIRLTLIPWSTIKHNLNEGWNLFLSTIGINLYRESSIVILGILTNYSVVGIYSPAEKLIKGLQSFSNIIVTSVFPFFSRKIGDDKNLGKELFFKVGKWILVLFGLISIFLFIGAPYIIRLYLGNAVHDNTIIDFRILSLVLLFGGLNYYYGVVGMVSLGLETVFNKVVWISGILGITACFILSYLYADIGASISMVVAELILLLLILKRLK